MSQLAPHSYQHTLAFNDSDLRRPDHDKIMLWLTDWVKDPANVRRFLPSAYSRSITYANRFDGESAALLPTLDRYEQQYLRGDLERLPVEPIKGYDGVWPDEPPFQIELKKSDWEYILRDHRGRRLGFCDLRCVYECSCHLYKSVVQHYRICIGSEDGFRHRTCRIEKSEITERIHLSGPNAYHLLFEVKSEIKSIGELMRQLQFYRTSTALREPFPYAQLIVVAPSNNAATSIFKENGFEFLEYRPSQMAPAPSGAGA